MDPTNAGPRPAVTIILPTYNRAKFLPQAFASIKSQTFTDWELIVVDDGSTDDTAAIVAELTAGWPQKVTYFKQENQGAYGARNTGLDHATGEYIAFFDSDDVWLSHHLADCVAGLQANPDVDWVWGACRIIDFATGKEIAPNTFYVEGKSRQFMMLQTRTSGRLKVITDPDCLTGYISNGFFCGLQNSVIRYRVFEGCRFATEPRNEGEDLLLPIRAILRGSRFAYFDEIHVNYFVHESNSSIPTGSQASVEKQIRTMRLCIEGFERIRRELPTRRSKRVLDQMIANHYFWTIGYALYLKHGQRREALAMFQKALSIWPWQLRFWKTYILTILRRFPWRPGAVPRTAK